MPAVVAMNALWPVIAVGGFVLGIVIGFWGHDWF